MLSYDVITNYVNRRYLAMRGMLTEVGGKILETRSRKTTRARRIEMVNYEHSMRQRCG